MYVVCVGVLALTAFYCAFRQLQPPYVEAASKVFVDPLAADRYQEYAPSDFVGEKTISQNAFSWRHETWTGDDKPYQNVRRTIDAAIAIGKSPERVVLQYEAEAGKNKKSSLEQFRWAYALWKIGLRGATSEQREADDNNNRGAFFALAKIASPNTYNYARLRYLVSYSSGEQTMLGERLLQRDASDQEVKAHLALDYTTPGLEPFNSKAKTRGIELAKDLIQSEPKEPRNYAILAEVYYTAYYINGHHRQDASATIAALRKYLTLAKPNQYFYEQAKSRIFDLQYKTNQSQ